MATSCTPSQSFDHLTYKLYINWDYQLDAHKSKGFIVATSSSWTYPLSTRLSMYWSNDPLSLHLILWAHIYIQRIVSLGTMPSIPTSYFSKYLTLSTWHFRFRLLSCLAVSVTVGSLKLKTAMKRANLTCFRSEVICLPCLLIHPSLSQWGNSTSQTFSRVE